MTPSSTASNCFTKGYCSKNILGAGSLLASDAFAAAYCSLDERGRLHLTACNEEVLDAASKAGALRFLSPREIGNLHGLPVEGFAFPAGTSLRQQYQLLGNGLSVDCVALLLRHLLGRVQLPGRAGTG